MSNDITDKQLRFCREYVIDLNGTQAAIRAEYAENSAHVQASQLLSIPKIQAEIARLKAEQAKRLDLSADRVLQEIAKVAFGDVRGMFDEDGALKRPQDWDDETAAAIAGMDIVTVQAGEGAVEYVAKIKRADRLRAMDMLARHLSLYNDKLEVNIKSELGARLQRAKKRMKK